MFRPTSDIHALLSDALWKLKPFQESRDEANSDIAPTSDGDNEIATCSIPHIKSFTHSDSDTKLYEITMNSILTSKSQRLTHSFGQQYVA